LIHVGNDIVDLAAPQAQGKTLRHMQKILTPDEIDAVLKSGDPHSFLWMFWTAKEAAFKVFSKLFSGISFSPKQYSVIIDHATHRGNVISPFGSVSLLLQTSKDWIHCISTTDDSVFFNSVKSGVEAIDFSLFKDDCNRADVESNAVRLAARKNLAECLNVEPDIIDIIRAADHHGRLQPPTVRINGVATDMDMDISLSHDGRFIAYCFLYGAKLQGYFQ
jgi:hypothetical protein